MNPEVISPDLKSVLRRLKLSRMLDTLPERLDLYIAQDSGGIIRVKDLRNARKD